MTDVNKEQVLEQVTSALVELFEIDAADITLDAKLYTDLDLDSIDAVDLVVHLQKVTGKKIKPEEFKEVRTVEDVVNSVAALLK
ncbi:MULTISPECIES: acyl carrier protein [Aliivibrio]|jgi:acyl carrier protein|uniref:Acyl carrier protein n=3 Tax=Aliivibrio TaxID=511678 RepID=A0A1B9P1T9_ALILO|nr:MULTISPECIES: acyl carrier protein [Aliivibrio]AZL85270.1 acyl carrier protein [Aliivibrio salmonicida]MBB1314307.1 acyl carrier protein [Aliivibrio sp. SR45-2]OCH22301.1 acyl carrier protein [Aliivibrio logei]OEF13511.1 acyl carrier protein [Aliivibrio logei 5S-186]CAQ79787.1 putative acyl carrier protein [Aliivibrio salmonicida LFI1238]